MTRLCPLCECSTYQDFKVLDHRVIVKCQACEFVYTNSYSSKALKEHYKKRYYSSSTDPRIEQWINDKERTFKGLVISVVKAFAKDITSLLDIGCGTGGFLMSFSKQSPKTQLFALEQSNDAIESLKRRMPSLIFKGAHSNDLKGDDQLYDVITLLQCLEHVENPQSLCDDIYNSLKPNGMLFVTVPNRKSYKVFLEGLEKEDMCYGDETHLQFFTKKHIRQVLQNSGFSKIVCLRDFGRSESRGIMSLIQFVFRLLGISTELRFVAFK
ncbi:class I SAM-dependent methyltransferase [Lentisphaera marina]|uniref:class I SAM-dependent methyltransferase n=1 Tax=Lentisphaera marina TaxID=1111041 RepID=UPI0023660526|nr:class I SAM-dependent methyltransferase [Lentisphaera marina]MDD7985745.1 class I SAM-dependent methyltransferase [Lentisphaera marina]